MKLFVIFATIWICTWLQIHSFYIFFLDIPIVTVASNQYSVNIGNSITLECTVVASPTHNSVYWERNVNGVSTRITLNTGKYSGSTVNTPSLTISNAENNDEGFYICFATNSVGTGQSANTFLDVIGSKWIFWFQSLYATPSKGHSSEMSDALR